MILPKLELNGNLIIVIVGLPSSGKSSVALFLIDALWDSGIMHIKDKRTLIADLLSQSPLGNTGHRVIIYDEVGHKYELEELRKYNALVIRVRRFGEVPNESYQWVENCNPDFVLPNDDSLRRLEFIVRDAIKNLLPETKQWKLAINYE